MITYDHEIRQNIITRIIIIIMSMLFNVNTIKEYIEFMWV